jgi:hypothetical protein
MICGNMRDPMDEVKSAANAYGEEVPSITKLDQLQIQQRSIANCGGSNKTLQTLAQNLFRSKQRLLGIKRKRVNRSFSNCRSPVGGDSHFWKGFLQWGEICHDIEFIDIL